MALATATTEEPSIGLHEPLRVRWLGTVDYAEAWDLQSALFAGVGQHLLLCEHRPVYTMGVRTDAANMLVDPTTVGAELHRVNRGGDVTFHGLGQLVGYPILSVAGKRGGGMADTVVYVDAVEQAIIDAVADLGLKTSRIAGLPGVWVEGDSQRPRKLAAVGVRLTRGRTMHGFALNVDVDLDWFSHIIPCGIAGKGVTSLAAERIDASMTDVVDRIVERCGEHLTSERPIERQDVAWRVRTSDLAPFTRGEGPGTIDRPTAKAGSPTAGTARQEPTPVSLTPRSERRLTEAGVDVDGGVDPTERKPPWMRVKLRTDPGYLELKKLTRSLDLTTVCEEAGCPNIFECWNEGTATFMLLGERCTRACGFCLVDTRKPAAPDLGEPARVADAVRSLSLDFAVLTMVARDDLDDGGAHIVAETIEAIRASSPTTGVEVLISDLGGSAESLAVVCDARPDVLNHNVETVPRLQRAVRPSASYGRSLGVLARGWASGLPTKSGLIVGMGERVDEVKGTLADLASIGVGIVTIGQYLRPTSHHLPVQRWWTPAEFDDLRHYGENELGIERVEASPLTRSSHNAGSVARSIGANP